MAATEQELNQFLQVPKMKARVRRFLKLNSTKTLEDILAELEEEKSVSPLVNYNSPLYRSIMTLVQTYYKEEQKIVLNLQIFYQNQAKLEKLSTADLKSSRTLNSTSHHILDEEKPFKSQEHQSLWERLRVLQKEIQDLQQQREEAEQELEKVVIEKEKVTEQIAAVERLSNTDKAQVHTQQIKDFAIVQRDRIDQGLNLSPSEVRAFTTNAQFRQNKATEFSEKKVNLEKKEETFAKKIENVINKIDATRTELNEKYAEHNALQATPALQNTQLQPYQLLPNLSITQRIDNFISKIIKTPSWMKAVKANKDEEKAEKEAYENQTRPTPMAAPAA